MKLKFKKTFKKFAADFINWLEYIIGLEPEEPTDEEIQAELQNCIRLIKERNSKIVFDSYYYPLAQQAILEEENYLASGCTVEHRARAMLLSDIADGTLDDFYRFREIAE